jgi:pyruvate, orthophosphate dikinase
VAARGLTAGRWVMPVTGGGLPDRDLIGGKAWSIARMGSLGLPVPPAFVVTTRACHAYLESELLPDGLVEEIAAGIAWLEQETGRRFGGGPRPLLVSVRSGAPVSMPGMMDTILNLGINDETEAALAAESRDAAFARDTHRRFVELYAGIVLKAEPVALGEHDDFRAWRGAVERAAGAPLPPDVLDQLHGAVAAVFASWNSRRARRYREHHGVPGHYGTAVVVQAMVFGNLCDDSGTGVLFTRNPVTGERAPFGEFLPRAQGEDVVSGRHTPLPLETMRHRHAEAHRTLLEAAALLERENGDVQDIEFTVERGRLYLLQSRAAKRAPQAAIRIASEIVCEGLTTADAAFSKLTMEQARLALGARLARDVAAAAVVLARGEPASPGIGCGVVVTDSDAAESRARAGGDLVLARATTSPSDLHGMIAARAIITEQGGSTSHAAVVGRALGRPCVVGCGAGTLLGLAGRAVTVDGGSGVIYDGLLPLDIPDETSDPSLAALLEWADRRSPVRVMRSAPTEGPIIDLDQVADAADPESLARLLRDVPVGSVFRGQVLTSEKAVAACVRAEAQGLIANPRLPVLLAAIRAAADVTTGLPKDLQQ